MKSRKSLEDRFITFLSQLDNAENIDDTFSESELSNGKRADFLLDGRRYVIEIKSLETDPEYKVEERLKPYRERRDFPIVYGEVGLNRVLSVMSDGQKINKKIVHAITRQVQSALEKADDQIEATKKALSLKEACGVVVILNEKVSILSPELLVHTVNNMLLKKRNGDWRYKSIAYVWILSEKHCLITPGKTKYIPLILIEGPNATSYHQALTYLQQLQKRWAEFMGVPFCEVNFDYKNFKD